MNKHPDDYVFGMDKAIQDKMKAKFCPVKEKEAKAWIEEVTGVPYSDPKSTQKSLKNGVHLLTLMNILTEELRSIQNANLDHWDEKKNKWGAGAFATKGDAKLDNFKFLPTYNSGAHKTWRTRSSGEIRSLKIQKPKDGKELKPFVCRENITMYIEACKSMGMTDIDCFVSTDLYGGADIMKVIDQVKQLGSICGNPRMYWSGVTIGKAIATESKRTFSEATLAKGRKIVPLQSAGSIAVEKEKGTDHIVKYAKAGVGLGKSVGGVSQQNAGSIEVAKGEGTDAIVRYGKVGQEMGVSVGGVSQQNAGSIVVEREGKTDAIVRYGLVGTDMGDSVGGTSQQTEGCLPTDKESKLDAISRALN